MKLRLAEWGWYHPTDDGIPQQMFVLAAVQWARNGSWASRYTNGRRLFYMWADVIVLNLHVLVRVDFETLWLPKADRARQSKVPT